MLDPVPSSSDLHWDAGLDPFLAQVAVGWDVAVVGGSSQQEDDTQDVVSSWNCDETEHEQDSPLERAPGPQERHSPLVVLHFTGLYFYSILFYSMFFTL